MISGIYRAFNCSLMDYPLEESIRSSLDLCDEICVSIRESADDTLDIVEKLSEEFPGRIKYRVDTFDLDRYWLVKAWKHAVSLASGDWLALIDADEAFRKETAEDLRNKILNAPDYIKLVHMKVVHYYGTPKWITTSPHFYKSHTRIGHRSVDFRIENFRTDNNRAPIDDVVATINGKKVMAHHYRGKEVLKCGQLLHYGWTRFPEQMGQHSVMGRDWYENTKKFADGSIPEPTGFRYNMDLSALARNKFPHPSVMQPWFDEHAEIWNQIEEEIKR